MIESTLTLTADKFEISIKADEDDTKEEDNETNMQKEKDTKFAVEIEARERLDEATQGNESIVRKEKRKMTAKPDHKDQHVTQSSRSTMCYLS